MFKRDDKHLDRLVDVQTRWQTLGQAGRHTDRNENTWTGWQTFRQDGKHLDRLADVQTGCKQLDSMEDVQMQTDD
jgi:hypothetical protein